MIRPKQILFLLIGAICLMNPFILAVQNSWDSSTYPDELGYQNRIAPMLNRIAQLDFGKRSLAASKCPDTGLPVRIWAVAGETIISPILAKPSNKGLQVILD